MEPSHLIRTSLWLLAAAAAMGLYMAGIRFAKDQSPPALLSKAHGILTSSAIAILSYGWATVGLPKVATIALALLLVAALGGLVTSQAWRWKLAGHVPSLLFAHLSVAAVGFFLLLAASGP